MTKFDDIWKKFSKTLEGSSLTEKQKYWLLLRIQNILMKEIASADNVICNITEKLAENPRASTKPDKKIMAERATAQNYRKAYIPLQDCLNRYCKEIIASVTDDTGLSSTEQKYLTESIDSPNQCMDSTARKKIHKLLCGFSTAAKRKRGGK